MENTEKTTLEERTLCVTVDATDTVPLGRDEYEQLLGDRIRLNFLHHMYMNTRSSYHMDDPLQFVFGKRPPEKKDGDDDGAE